MKKIFISLSVVLLIIMQSCMIAANISDLNTNYPIESNYIDDFTKDHIIKSQEIAFRDTNSNRVITIQIFIINDSLSAKVGLGITGEKSFYVSKDNKLSFLFEDGSVSNFILTETKVSEYKVYQFGYYTTTHHYIYTNAYLDPNMLYYLESKTIKKVRFETSNGYVQVNNVDKIYSDKVNLLIRNFYYQAIYSPDRKK